MIHNERQCIRQKNDIRAINVQRVNENHYISWIEDMRSRNNSRSRNNKNKNRNTLRRKRNNL
jgi:hypothetical protein